MKKPLIIIAIIGLIVAGFLFGYDKYQDRQLVDNLSVLNQQFASSTEALNAEIKILKDSIVAADERNVSLAEAIKAEQERTSAVKENLEQIAGTVGTLQKLSRTDPELLQKYSKTFFLNEHYAPERLTEIEPLYLADKTRPQQLHTGVWFFLEKLLRAAAEDKIDLKIVSGYRSFDTQSALKTNYRMIYGPGTANQFSADQGYSEHQLGTTVDFSTLALAAGVNGFEKTVAYDWLNKNAYRYGFVISYPLTNTYYQFEPWHWRFVGRALATRLHNDNKFFYDLDQRAIDEYLVKIFD